MPLLLLSYLQYNQDKASYEKGGIVYHQFTTIPPSLLPYHLLIHIHKNIGKLYIAYIGTQQYPKIIVLDDFHIDWETN
jgi:hypothetical protein